MESVNRLWNLNTGLHRPQCDQDTLATLNDPIMKMSLLLMGSKSVADFTDVEDAVIAFNLMFENTGKDLRVFSVFEGECATCGAQCEVAA